MSCYACVALQGFRKLVHEMKLEKQTILHDSAKQHERVQEYQREMLAMQARAVLPGASDRGHVVLPGVLRAVCMVFGRVLRYAGQDACRGDE